QEWKSPSDPDARITKMKDGRTHLAHKAEHAVDLSSGALLAVTLQGANVGDTTTIQADAERGAVGGAGGQSGWRGRVGGRQGISQRGGADRPSWGWSSELHPRAGARSAELEWQG